MARSTLRAFEPVMPVDHTVVDLARRLMEETPRLHARDAVHVATCLTNGLTHIVSPDTAFDVVDAIVRVDPTDWLAAQR